MNFDLRYLRNVDWVLLAAVLALGTVGLLAVASATRGQFGEHWTGYVAKQAAGLVLGLLGLVFVLAFDYTEFQRMYRFLYVLNLMLLALVYVPGLGKEINGTRGWVDLRLFQVQPAELAKVLVILTLATLLARQEGRANSFWDLLLAGAHIAPALGLILLQPDLGTALVLLAILAAMLYMAGMSGWRLVLVGLALVSVVAALVVANVRYGIHIPGVSQYQIDRILCWLEPHRDIRNACYNVIQARIAIATTQLPGAGLFRGTQTQLGYVPESHTDFIFTAVAEELGFIGASAVLMTFLVVLWRILMAAMHAKDRYGVLLVSGVAAMIGFHVLENAGMVVGLTPVTGIPLPFISYGPTSAVANLIAVGLVLNVNMRRHTLLF